MGAVYVLFISTFVGAVVLASPQRMSNVGERFDVYQNGEKIGSEQLKFERESGLITLEGDDGSFTIQDINKALMIIKYANNAMCYLSAMETSPNEGEAVEEMIQTSQQSFDTKQVEITTNDMTYRKLSGEVKDTSFLPETAVERCEQGFQWRIQTDVNPTSESRVKRAFRCNQPICTREFDFDCLCYYDRSCRVSCGW